MNIKKMIKLKSVLLLCLVWVCAFAAPVQSQVATALTCAGNTLADGTDYALNADCSAAGTAMTVAAGVTATVDGRDFTISGATGTVISVTGAGASLTVSDLTISGATADPVISVLGGSSLTLNNVTITGSGAANGRILRIEQGSTVDARNVIFRDNVVQRVVHVGGGGDSTVDLTNVQFLNNGGPGQADGRMGSAIFVWASADTVVNINGATFSGNTGQAAVVSAENGTINIRGCVRVSGNTNAAGDGPAVFTRSHADDGTITGGPGGCPSRKKKEKTPVPTATERPPTAATCVGLRETTGIAVNATFGLASGVQCQQLDGGGIGIQALADNYIAAVDIWGYVDQGVEVCFPQATGRIFFLDARMIPRSVVPMQSYVADNMLCASTETPGSIVLLPPE